MKPFRFGAAVDPSPDGTWWANKARRVEDLGYSTLLVADHLVNPFAPTPALAVAAAATSTLRVGTMVYANDFRHPAILAKDTATLDVLTDGRVEVGIGAGWLRAEYDAVGLAYDDPATRVARLGEAVAVLKGLWSGEPFTFHGDHYDIDGFAGSPKPAHLPHPPLMIGGSGARVLDLAAREANIVSISPHVDANGAPRIDSLSRDKIAAKLDRVRAQAGARAGELEFSIYYGTPARLTDDVGAAATQIAAEASQRYGQPVSPDLVRESPFYLFGDVERCVDTLVERRESLGFSYLVICGDDSIEQLAPVVARLAGT